MTDDLKARLRALHERIYLEPSECACPDTGALWCPDPMESPNEAGADVPWIEYVRADKVEALEVENARLKKIEAEHVRLVNAAGDVAGWLRSLHEADLDQAAADSVTVGMVFQQEAIAEAARLRAALNPEQQP